MTDIKKAPSVVHSMWSNISSHNYSMCSTCVLVSSAKNVSVQENSAVAACGGAVSEKVRRLLTEGHH